MKHKNILHSLIALVALASLAFSNWHPAVKGASQAGTSGWFSIIWGDAPDGSPAPEPVYTLTDDSGQTTRLLLDEALAADLGGVLALDRQRVAVQGAEALSAFGQGSGGAALQVESITLENPPAELGAQDVSSQAITGSQPFISIMCKFADVGTEPKNLAYFQGMYGSVYPGLDHYWRESSYNTANILGSAAVGWYTLPQPRSYYIVNNALNHSRAANDCTAVANAAVNFAPFKGINMMFNGELDGYAWGGSQFMTLDGVSKSWPMTWEPPWGYKDITVMSHEMGHAFGLPHSSGAYGATYDNQWDVMSDTWTTCSRASHATYGCLGQHPISYHKNRLGWIPAGDKYTANGNATITLEQLALPQTGNYKMAQIPIGGSSTHFYTVEVRRQSGYDVKLPGQGVIIHDVDLARSRPANVIDADGNGNTGDAGAIWAVGETFSDAANGIRVTVVSATGSSFRVTIQSAATQATAVFRSAGSNDGWVLESGENSNKGGALENAASTFNLGDNAADKQYRAILDFDTSSLPDDVVITKVTLRIMKQGLAGTNPFSTHGVLRADIRSLFFGANAILQAGDFQAAANNTSAAQFGAAPAGNWYSAVLNSAGRAFVNPTGVTQFRLRFAADDNNDNGADFMRFYSGNVATVAYRPQLIIHYAP